MKTDWLIVGAGFSGAVLAERIATQLNQKVMIIDRRPHVGGNAHDYYNEHGILVHRYGPHIFHTNSKKIWDYLSKFTEWRIYYHHVLGMIDGKAVPVPFNIDTMYALLPPMYAARFSDLLIQQFGFNARVPILKLRESTGGELAFLADYVYRKMFYNYTIKQWELKPEELDPSVTARVQINVSRDCRYFQDVYQAMPKLGFTEMFNAMLNHPNITIQLELDYKRALNEIQFDRLVYTGQIDGFFDYIHGHLPYRSLKFAQVTENVEFAQDVGTINYSNEFDFTRVTEMKHLTGQRGLSKTTLIYEYPERYIPGENDAYYPIPTVNSEKLLLPYREMANALKGKVFFIGRLADYKYYNMDQAVGRALAVFEKEILQ